MDKTVKHICILAMDAKAGMIQCYSDPRFDHVIDDVDLTRDGEVKIQHGNFTAVDWFKPDEYIWVQAN
jgi:hypothetical protein